MANTLRFKRGLVSTIPTALAGEPLFTTDTFDLYIGNGTTNTRFQKYIASGTTSQLLRGDGSLLTMPIVLTSPSTGQVLKYNGTSWVNDSDAGITGSGAAGQVAYFTGATTQSGSNNFFWDSSNSRLGIGTTSPAVLLHLQSSLTGTTTFSNVLQTFRTGAAGRDILLQFSDGTNQAYIGSLSGNLYFGTNGTNERARITSGGNFIINNPSTDNGLRFQVTGDGYFSGSVGIGVSPSVKLQVNNEIATTYSSANTLAGGVIAYIKNTSTTNSTDATIRLEATGSGDVAAASISAIHAGGGFSSLTFGTRASSSNVTERMRLDYAGNLGLGVVPSAWSLIKALQISGNAMIGGYNNQVYLGVNWVYDGADKYISNGFANRFLTSSGAYFWEVAPNNTSGAGAALTWSTRMTLDASGRLGIGTTSPSEQLNLQGANAYTSKIRFTYGSGASGYYTNLGYNSDGNKFYLQIADGTTPVNIMTWNYTGNVGVGTTADAGYKLDVNGTMRVSGASTFNGAVTLTINQNGQTISTVRNTTAGTSSEAYFQATSDASSGSSTFGKTSSLFSGYKILTASSGYIYNGTAGNLAILNDVASGSIVMAAGGSSTAHFTIASTGAATFSSSVTATENYQSNSYTNTVSVGTTLAGNKTYNYIGYSGYWGIKTTSTNFNFSLDVYNSGTPINALTINQIGGAATFGSSIQASTAIAIGTTPDTNKPFKVLKNINGTVGINFENTSTGSLAFSAIQMGTDVTGGTKFTNLVYSSSGVTASGVYQPDGTSLINNGSGGLNFLGNPIRMYTGGSNGTLRWDMTNDGFITQYSGTNPSTNATDGYRQYSADVVAGNAAPHFRTENGAIIKLYQETTGVGNSIISLGGGNAVLDDTTFDGYTLRQIVKALRNQGILA